MRQGRGFANRQAFMEEYVPFRQPTPAEEKSRPEDVARRLEEKLVSVKERMEKQRSDV
jgi:hypothetical protein